MNPYLSIHDYLTTKSVKLTDSYSVTVTDREMSWPGDENLTDIFSAEDIQNYGIELGKDSEGYLTRRFTFKNCIGFEPPVYAPREELIKFGNKTRVAYLPNTDKPKPIGINFFETEKKYAKKFIQYALRKSFWDENEETSQDHYRPFRYIDEIRIDIYDNKLKKRVLSHIFGSCRLVDYDYAYSLDYMGKGLILPRAVFSFLKYDVDPDPEE